MRRLLAALVLVVACAFAPPALAGTTVINEPDRLAITGDDGPNDVSIDLSDDASAYLVTIGGGIDVSTGCVSLSAGRLRCPRQDTGPQSFRIDASSHFGGGTEGLGAGNDSFKAGYGSDDLHAGFELVLVDLGPGDDFFGGSETSDRVYGQGGNDVLDGAEGRDELNGGDLDLAAPAGSDRLFGGPGDDSLTDGDSTLNHGPDLLDGGGCSQSAHSSCPAVPLEEAPGDNDQVSYFYGRTASVTLNLANPAASQGESGEGDIVRNVESATTGTGDDRVTGNAARNYFDTTGGNDNLDVSGDYGGIRSWDLVQCGGGSEDAATLDADDQLDASVTRSSGCEAVNQGAHPPPAPPPTPPPLCNGVPCVIGGPASPMPAFPGGPSQPPGGTSPGLPGAPAIGAVTRELAQAGRALARCGTTGLLSKGGCRDSFTAPRRGIVVYRVTAPAADAGAAAALIASGRRVIPEAGSYPVGVKATKKGRRRLRRARKLRATLTVTFTDSMGNVAKRSKKVILKRKRR